MFVRETCNTFPVTVVQIAPFHAAAVPYALQMMGRAR